MTVDDFIAAQQEIIAKDGIDQYLPTLWVDSPKSLQVNVLEDPPDVVTLSACARDWAEHVARKHGYFLSFKTAGI